ncbi:MAG: hypothetical protein R3184_03625 [Aurantimonas coralicida]|nr:hypothetical protein [Aurantimonas coralicida]
MMVKACVRTYWLTAALVLGAFTGGTHAVECPAFIAGLTEAGPLRPEQVKPAADMPVGYYQFEGLPQIKGGLRCKSGALDTVGATALSGSADVMQSWTLLVSRSLEGVAPGGDNNAEVAEAIGRAKAAAAKNREALGVATGSGQVQIGDWYLSVVIIPNVGLQFELSGD